MDKEPVRGNKQIIVRANASIWKIAKFIHDAGITYGDETFEQYRPWYKNKLYDKAAILLKKITNNEFTGEDNHGD